MSSVYAPGKPNPYFPVHKYHGIAIGQNLKPIDECRTHHYVGAAATVQKAIASCQLTAEHLWLTFQREAEDVIKENGVFIADDTKRNKKINAAYASCGWRTTDFSGQVSQELPCRKRFRCIHLFLRVYVEDSVCKMIALVR